MLLSSKVFLFQLGCHNKMPQMEWLLFSQSGGWMSKIKVRGGLLFGETLPLSCRRLPSHRIDGYIVGIVQFSLCPHTAFPQQSQCGRQLFLGAPIRRRHEEPLPRGPRWPGRTQGLQRLTPDPAGRPVSGAHPRALADPLGPRTTFVPSRAPALCPNYPGRPYIGADLWREADGRTPGPRGAEGLA